MLYSGKQAHIHLAGGDANTGYRIHKLQLFAQLPGAASQESVVKIYQDKQTSVDGTVDFGDDTLLASAYLLNHLTATDNPAYMFAIFDNEHINQDIYITHADVKNGNTNINYYLELEEFKMNDSEVAVVNYKAALLHGE